MRFGVVALVLGCAVASTASEPERARAESPTGYEAEAVETAGEIGARIGPEVLIAAWLVAFAALSALYAYDRRHQLAGREHLSHRLVALRRATPAAAAGLEAERWSDAGQRAGTGLFKKKKHAVASSRQAQRASPQRAAGGSNELRQEAAAAALEEATPQRRRSGLGATQAGEETFRVTDPERLESSAVAASEQAVASVTAPVVSTDAVRPESPQAPAPTAPTVGQQAPREATDPPDCVRQCAALREAGRFAEAARLARAGLAGAADTGPLLVELSRSELGLGRVNAAIDIARDAHFASRSRESVAHLIRLLTETRRFAREDGPSLRRAASRHPRQPLLLFAAGVFESMHGRPCDAEKWLRAALPLAPDEEARRAIAGELSRVEESRARSAS